MKSWATLLAASIGGFAAGALAMYLLLGSPQHVAGSAGSLSIGGRIVGQDGQPIHVSIYRLARPVDTFIRVHRVDLLATSDSAGYFLIPDLPSGTYYLSFKVEKGPAHVGVYKRKIVLGDASVDLGTVRVDVDAAVAALPSHVKDMIREAEPDAAAGPPIIINLRPDGSPRRGTGGYSDKVITVPMSGGQGGGAEIAPQPPDGSDAAMPSEGEGRETE